MRNRQARESSVSSLHLAGGVFALLAALIAAALMLAPERPPPPPPSAAAYEARPEQRPSEYIPMQDTRAPQPRRTQPVTPAAAPPPPPEPAPSAAYRIEGRVYDARTGEGVRATLRAEWHPTAEELAAEQEAERALLDAGDEIGWRELIDARREQTRRERAARWVQADAEGAFTLNVQTPGQYAVRISTNDYLPHPAELVTVTSEDEPAYMEVALSQGATVRGTIREMGSGQGIAGVTVWASMGGDARWGYSGEDGRYEITGIESGALFIQINLRDVKFQPAGALPFRRLVVQDANQIIENVDFELQRAGAVWGYVLDQDGNPVEHAALYLTTSASFVSQALNALVNQAPPLRSATREHGYYELMGVPFNEEWRVYAESGNFAPQLSKPFMVTESQSEIRIDIYLASGTRVHGRVVDPRGNPAPHANVYCLPGYARMFTAMEAPQAFRETSADENGAFVIDDLPAGDYQLLARKQGFRIALSGVPVFSDGRNSVHNVEVVLFPVEAGDNAVYGTVRDRNGIAIPGAQARLSGLGAESLTEHGRSAATGADGRFRFEGVEPGLYMLQVEKEGFAPRMLRDVRLNREIEVTLLSSAIVRGRVQVRGESAPPPQYTVAARSLDQEDEDLFELFSLWQPPIEAAFNDPEGRFELRVDPGAYRITASAEGHAPGNAEIEALGGQTIDNVILLLEPGGGRISGTVETADRRSSSGARVTLLEGDVPLDTLIGAGLENLPGARSVFADSDGAFTFANLAAGEYLVAAEHPNYTPGHAGPLALEPGGIASGVVIELGFGGVLEGYVTVDGRLRPEAVIFVLAGAEPRMTTTDQNGYYRLENLPPGMLTVTAVPHGITSINSLYETRMARVEIIEGQTTTHNFGEESGARIEGFLDNLPRGLLGGAAVLRFPGPAPFALGQTVPATSLLTGLGMFRTAPFDRDGYFVIEDVPPGEYMIDVYVNVGLINLRYGANLYVSVGEEDLSVQATLEF